MITTRSLLCDFVTARWIAWNLQRLKSFLLSASSRLPFFALNLRVSVGRYFTPFLRAALMSLFRRFSESFLHTTRVVPGGFVLSADASVRTFGTLPPAAGLTDVSGLGSGQYAVRSTCAKAAVASASEATSVATSPAIQLRPATNPPLV